MRKTMAIAALAAVAIASLLISLSGTMAGLSAYREQRVLAATVQMERLASRLEHVRTISPETRLEVTRLTRDFWSDCAQATCRTTLESRNHTARERLLTLVSAPTVGRQNEVE